MRTAVLAFALFLLGVGCEKGSTESAPEKAAPAEEPGKQEAKPEAAKPEAPKPGSQAGEAVRLEDEVHEPEGEGSKTAPARDEKREKKAPGGSGGGTPPRSYE